VAIDSDQHIYTVDANFDNYQIFNSKGQLLLYVGKTGSKYGQFFMPNGIFIDHEDRIYVSDSYNRRVQIFQYVKENNDK
jgi:sugar lactone lactonase YvrE